MFIFFIFFIAGFGFLAAGLRFRSKSAQAKTWPTVTGKIINVEFDDAIDPSSSDVVSYQTNVTYSYLVSGKQYQASRIAFGYSASINHKAQFELYTRLTQSPSVLVRYNPILPSEATLEFIPCNSSTGLIKFAVLWISLTLIFAIVTYMNPASSLKHI